MLTYVHITARATNGGAAISTYIYHVHTCVFIHINIYVYIDDIHTHIYIYICIYIYVSKYICVF